MPLEGVSHRETSPAGYPRTEVGPFAVCNARRPCRLLLVRKCFHAWQTRTRLQLMEKDCGGQLSVALRKRMRNVQTKLKEQLPGIFDGFIHHVDSTKTKKVDKDI